TLTSGALRSITNVNEQRVITAGFFGQEEIGWRDRLFVTGGLRVDGNSAFGSGFGLQKYPKLGVSYVLSDEPYWKLPWIETFKARVALGESGKAPGPLDAARTQKLSGRARRCARGIRGRRKTVSRRSSRRRSATRNSVPSARAKRRA